MRTKRRIAVIAGAAAAALAASAGSCRPVDALPSDRAASLWTVLAIAPDGSWGVANEIDSYRAIANAIANCRAMSGKRIGCGYRFTAIRAGWSVAWRCGSENIIAAEKTLADAERAAATRERSLRTDYVPDMPACIRVLAVDPRGVIVGDGAGY